MLIKLEVTVGILRKLLFFSSDFYKTWIQIRISKKNVTQQQLIMEWILK